MQLLQQLTEQAAQQQRVTDLINVIKQAKPFFDGRNNDPHAWFYRGMRYSFSPPGLFGLETQRQSRGPADTTPEFHTMMDDRLLKDFGHRFRSEATFVVGDREMAHDYGPVSIILPIGEFDLVYSRTVKDAYNVLRARNLRAYVMAKAQEQGIDVSSQPGQYGTKAEELEFLKWMHSDPRLEAMIPDWFEQLYAKFGYTRGTVEEACLSGNEIMLNSPNHAAIPRRNAVHPDIVETVDRVLGTKIGLQFGESSPTTENLLNAIAAHIFK